jgi:hypothetical protein
MGFVFGILQCSNKKSIHIKIQKLIMNPLNFTRVRNRELSLWQSAVSENIRNEIRTSDAPVSHLDVLKHPLSIATSIHVDAAMDNSGYAPKAPASNEGQEAQVYRSHLAFHIGQALAKGDQEAADVLFAGYRKFSDMDPLFLTCATTYAEYAISTGKHMTYNDWTVEGNNNINYGVIDWKLPNDAKVAILGDWGTGMPDAVALLKDIMVKHSPQAIIHLGDIYYSGTPSECQDYFAGVFQQVFDEVLGVGNRIPVFSIPGNHDYYSWGAAYYSMMNNLNNFPGISNAVQPASYFSLRTEDMGWQFLGMDSGYNDSNPAHQIDPLYAGPWLENTEIQWLRDKLQNFNGGTILLSHHQVFSSNSAINGKLTPYHNQAPYNPFLYSAVWDYLPTKVAGWLWGHEHNFVMYNYGMNNVTGRLLGNSAYEELVSADPYKINYPAVQYLVPEPQYDQYKLGTTADSNGTTYYNHGYGIIDLGGRANPTDKVEVSYYQFPSWGDNPPLNPQSSLMYSEPFALPTPQRTDAITSGYGFMLMSQEGSFFSSIDVDATGYYPTLSPNGGQAAMMILTKYVNGVAQPQGTPILDGDTVYMSINLGLETWPKILTVGHIPSLFFDYQVDGDNALWTVRKRDTQNGDSSIHWQDAIYFVNQGYSGQWLVPNYGVTYNYDYLTTKANANYYWAASWYP